MASIYVKVKLVMTMVYGSASSLAPSGGRHKVVLEDMEEVSMPAQRVRGRPQGSERGRSVHRGGFNDVKQPFVYSSAVVPQALQMNPDTWQNVAVPKKRKARPETWKRNTRQNKQLYPLQTCGCVKQCFEKLDVNKVESMRQAYQQLNADDKRHFLLRYIIRDRSQSNKLLLRYRVEDSVGTREVCREMFKHIFCVYNVYLRNLRAQLEDEHFSGTLAPQMRGKHGKQLKTEPELIQCMINYINEIALR
jgi:hypothetical protein